MSDSKNTRLIRQMSVGLVIGLILGVIIGLLIGWVLWPVEYQQAFTYQLVDAQSGGTLASQRITGASATLGLELGRSRAHFEHGLLEGLDARLHVARRRDAAPGDEMAFRIHHRP